MIITDTAAIHEVLDAAPILYLALHAEPAPHVVPVCFGRDGEVLYIHGSLRGRKIELIRADPRVGFSACTDVKIQAGADACGWSASGRSVVGTGRARVVEDEAERIRGLDAIMRHYDPSWEKSRVGDEGSGRPRYRPGSLSRTAVIAIQVEACTGKRTGPAEAAESATGNAVGDAPGDAAAAQMVRPGPK